MPMGIMISVIISTSYWNNPSAKPANPRNDNDTIAAAINVIGRPLSDSGISFPSKRPRTPAKITIATKKPIPAANELTIDCTKE